MKKICFFTAGVLPVPPVKGGAVENLIKLIIDRNEKCHDAELYVSSIFDKEAEIDSQEYSHCLFNFIKIPKFISFCDILIYSVAKLLLKKRALSFRMIMARLWYIYRSKKYFLDNDFDFIIAENHVSLFLVMKDTRMKKKYREKFIYHAHNEAYLETFGCKKQINDCPLILSVSEFISSSWKNIFPNSRAKYESVLNGINTEIFMQNITETDKTSLQKKLGIAENDFVIIFAGRLVEGKGIIQLARVFEKLPIENKKLLILGSAFFETNDKSPIQEKLENILYSCKEKVVFTGYIPYSEIWKYYQVSSISVFTPIWNEACALTNLEAQASSLPVITTISGGIPEFLNPESKILLPIDENLESSMLEKIMLLYNNPEKRVEIGTLNKNYVKRFSIESYYESFMKALGVKKI